MNFKIGVVGPKIFILLKVFTWGMNMVEQGNLHKNQTLELVVCLFVLRIYCPVNPMGSCRARSVYLTTPLLSRISPISS